MDTDAAPGVVVGLGWPVVCRSAGAERLAGLSRTSPLGWPSAPVRDGRHGRPRPVAAGEQPNAADADGTATNAPHVSRETASIAEGTGTNDARVARETASIAAGPAQFPRPATRRILTVANQKGGVGKTTTTVNLATALALHGARVLVVDLDPQGSASTGLGIAHPAGTASTYDVLIDGRALDDVIVATPTVAGLWCAPATIDLAGAEIELVPMAGREARLRDALARLQHAVDYVFVDCPPSLGLLTLNALVAAREVVIPVQCEFYALEGLGQLIATVERVREQLNPALAVSTILLTMYDGRTRLADQVAGDVRRHFGERVLTSTIPRSVRISEAPGFGESVVTYDPASRGAVSYVEAARELAERGAGKRAPE